jgi:hypothetical protein
MNKRGQSAWKDELKAIPIAGSSALLTNAGCTTGGVMVALYTDEPAPEAGYVSRFPALAKLRLCKEDLAELGRQGRIVPERRGDRTYYKLRFRRAGQQVVRCVGGAQEAALVAEELKALQSNRRQRLELDALNRTARHVLRDAKVKLERLLAERGFRFHGRAIRRSRRSHQRTNVSFPTHSRPGGQR